MVDNMRMEKSTLQNNLNRLLKEVGWTPTELARRSGVAQPTVKRILDGESKDPKRYNIEKIAKALLVSVESLFVDGYKYWPYDTRAINLTYSLYPNNEKSVPEKSPSVSEQNVRYANSATQSPQLSKEHSRFNNVENALLPVTKEVPLISWVQAGDWQQAIDEFQPGIADESYPCPVNHSTSTFALRVRGDSMTSPHGRSYPDGAIIFVDPELRGGITTGDRIIAKLNGFDKVVFKVYVEDAGKKYLKSLNPSYPVLTEEFRVLGKIIGMWVPE